ncbi:MAG: FliH/SctL family protein, partial [Actinomycetota bacterium]
VVRLHPDDAEGLGPVPGVGDRELIVATDPALSPGDAIVSVDQLTIDARLSESLRRVEEALR